MEDINSESINDQEFEFPHGILNQISECSPEGFILFAVNERGEVEVYQKFSVDVIEAGVRNRAIQILNTMNTVEDSEMTSQMLRQRHPEVDEEDTDNDAF